jgi:hypothetical protein
MVRNSSRYSPNFESFNSEHQGIFGELKVKQSYQQDLFPEKRVNRAKINGSGQHSAGPAQIGGRARGIP